MISSLWEEGAARGGGNPQKGLSPGFAERILSTGISSTFRKMFFEDQVVQLFQASHFSTQDQKWHFKKRPIKRVKEKNCYSWEILQSHRLGCEWVPCMPWCTSGTLSWILCQEISVATVKGDVAHLAFVSAGSECISVLGWRWESGLYLQDISWLLMSTL